MVARLRSLTGRNDNHIRRKTLLMFPSFIPPVVIYSGLIEARLSVNDADFTSHETLSTSEWWILSLELK